MQKRICWDIWKESYHFLCGIYSLNETAFKFQEYHIRSLNKVQLLLLKGKKGNIWWSCCLCQQELGYGENLTALGKLNTKSTYNEPAQRDRASWRRSPSDHTKMEHRKIKSPRGQSSQQQADPWIQSAWKRRANCGKSIRLELWRIT